MQELIESLQNDFKTNTRLKLKIESFNNFLEKEKEQIINAYEDGKENQRDSITNIYNYIIGEFYYNKTYKQKQHIIDIMKADEDDGLYNQNKI